MPEIARLHIITQDNLPERSHALQAEEACKGGADWIQFRAKTGSEEEKLTEAMKMRKITQKFGARLIINDQPKIALACNADGVHLGKEDMSPEEARKILGKNAIIGATVNNVEDLKRVLKQPVDYIGMGPYRFTTTKAKLSPVLGVDQLQELISEAKPKLPVILIGGLTLADVADVLSLGAHGLAVSGAIVAQADISSAAEAFVKTIEENIRP